MYFRGRILRRRPSNDLNEMPYDPNKRIERQLQTWAQKRRREAGPPSQLHAATRKLLQDEVARTYVRRRDTPEKKSLPLAVFWPRLVWALPALAVCVVAAALLLPSLTKSKSKAQAAFNLAKQEKSTPAEVDDKPAPATGKPGEFIPLRDEFAKTPEVSSRLAPTAPAPQVEPPTAEGLEAKDSLAAKVAAGREVAGERDARKSVDLAQDEKLREAPPAAQAT